MQGSCLCGDVKFEIIGNMPNLYQCHRSLCRIIFMAPIIGLLLALSGASHAGCHDLLIGQHSWHTDDTYEDDGKQHHYDNANPLLGCITDEGHVAAVFENSYGDASAVVGHRWQSDSLSDYISPYLVLGVAVGYKDHMAHVGAFSPYGFVGVDIHPADKSYGLMISTIGSVTTVGVRFALE